MITNAIVSAVLASIDALVTLLPVFTWPVRVVSGVFLFMAQANRVVPIVVAAAMLAVFLVLKLAMNGWEFALFIYHQVWGSS